MRLGSKKRQLEILLLSDCLPSQKKNKEHMFRKCPPNHQLVTLFQANSEFRKHIRMNDKTKAVTIK